jgi:lipoprotein-releasing system permease protein
MSPNFRIAVRFLTAKKRSMAMCLSCIILGVGLFIVTQATTTGFQKHFIDTILGTDGAVRIQDKEQNTIQTITAGGYGSGFAIEHKGGHRYEEGIDYPEDLKRSILTFGNVSGVSEVLHGSNVTVSSSFKNDTVQVFGINIADQLSVSDLGRQIVGGSIHDFEARASGALLGREMAERLQLSLGDTFLLIADGNVQRYTVSALYETGVEDIDRVRLYLKMADARSLLRKPTGISYFQVSLHDRDRAEADALWMQDIIHYKVDSWQYRQREWLGIFKLLQISTAITVSVFTLIAGLAMFNTLAMIVLEKTKDIAILRSMGYTREDISRIFFWQALIVLGVGAVSGCVLGAAVTYGVHLVPLQIRSIFTLDHVPVFPSPWHYVEAVATAVFTVLLASLVPARRAARLEPGDIIRGTAQ